MTDQAPIRILSVDDHPLMREGIGAIIGSQPDMSLVAEASSSGEAVLRYREHLPDITLMDLRLPDGSGIDAMIHQRPQSGRGNLDAPVAKGVPQHDFGRRTTADVADTHKENMLEHNFQS